jgi:hypothetical protein
MSCAGEMRRALGSHNTLFNRWKRWGERGVFTRMMEALAAGASHGGHTALHPVPAIAQRPGQIR